MALKFLQESPEKTLKKINTDLSFIDPDIDLTEYTGFSISKLNKELREVEDSIDARRRASTYGSWLWDESFTRDSLVAEGIRTILKKKRQAMREERLVPGVTYYTNVTRFGNVLKGYRSIYMGESFTGWMPFKENTAVAKAQLVLCHGTEDDFREIYIGMADGRPDALNKVSMEHVTESSKEALAQIEEYCDARWEGPWPWEEEAPEKLKMMIERREEKTMQKIEQMQRRFARMIREAEDGSMSQYEMVAASQEMMDRVDSMIGDLGKLSSNGIEVMAQAKASGDDSLVQPMQQALGDPLNSAVSALTDLKAALASATNTITGEGPTGDIGMDGDDELGTPGGAMGPEPGLGGDEADDLADVEIGGDEEERAMKEV